MSHFIGPNMYLIESAIKDGLYLNLDGGNKADGTKVLTKYDPLGYIQCRLSVANTTCALRSTKADDTSSHWAIVYLGIGDSSKEEYHLLNRATGTYLASTSGAKNREPITGTLTSPWRNIVRWSIVPVRNKTGLYKLVAIANKTQCIGVQGGSGSGPHEGSQAISFESGSSDKDLLWYLRLAPDAILNCVE